MKASEVLFEGPYHIGQDYVPTVKLGAFPSMEGLKRENDFLGTLEKVGIKYHFWLTKSKQRAKITTEGKDDIGQVRQRVVVEVEFQQSLGLPINNEIRVKQVYTDPDFRGGWLAGALYVVLVRYGFSVVSDFTQYNGGKALWKKLAKESEARNYVVRVWDDQTQDWIKDVNGRPVKYNVVNSNDQQIWKDISQHNEATTLLVLQNK